MSPSSLFRRIRKFNLSKETMLVVAVCRKIPFIGCVHVTRTSKLLKAVKLNVCWIQVAKVTAWIKYIMLAPSYLDAPSLPVLHALLNVRQKPLTQPYKALIRMVVVGLNGSRLVGHKGAISSKLSSEVKIAWSIGYLDSTVNIL